MAEEVAAAAATAGSFKISAKKRRQVGDDIPAAPNRIYKDKGWVSMGDWLGLHKPGSL